MKYILRIVRSTTYPWPYITVDGSGLVAIPKYFSIIFHIRCTLVLYISVWLLQLCFRHQSPCSISCSQLPAKLKADRATATKFHCSWLKRLHTMETTVCKINLYRSLLVQLPDQTPNLYPHCLCWPYSWNFWWTAAVQQRDLRGGDCSTVSMCSAAIAQHPNGTTTSHRLQKVC